MQCAYLTNKNLVLFTAFIVRSENGRDCRLLVHFLDQPFCLLQAECIGHTSGRLLYSDGSSEYSILVHDLYPHNLIGLHREGSNFSRVQGNQSRGSRGIFAYLGVKKITPWIGQRGSELSSFLLQFSCFALCPIPESHSIGPSPPSFLFW